MSTINEPTLDDCVGACPSDHRLFAVWAIDREGALAARLRVRESHRRRLREPTPHALRVVLAGPLLDCPAGTMIGTLLVVEAESLAAVRAFVADDPYVQAGVYEHVDVRAFNCGLGPLAASLPERLDGK